MNRLRCIVAGLLCLADPATAATREPAIPLPPIPPPALDETTTPDQLRLDHLAELIGTLAFLRDLCQAGDGAAWRSRMDALLEAEGTTQQRRDELAGSYNRGYAGYQATYRRCTPAAETAIARTLAEGSRLANEAAAKFKAP